ncbi:hypothetical protein PSH97_00180 [Pseudomonas cucumis]|uniref:Uncharacterized protein n=1 Tax=Pseudomonas cucumis TaxID=2954082 RepID=A0ABY9EX44_9PSED|nr:hypothetical protein [Pseudomonas cucumis]WLG84989.1 hypothetical protein PSH97_00180 [Pseudomonas cucumis]
MDIEHFPSQGEQLRSLRLAPPHLPSWTTPVQGYDGGIGVAASEGGLRFTINPWLNMDVGSVVRLYWGNDLSPIWTKTIGADEKDKQVHGTIDAGYIVRGDLFPLFYSVQRGPQVPEDSTPWLKLLVKLDRPGGFDDDYGEPGHSHLHYSIPQAIIDNGVGPAEAEAGVPITIMRYPFMRVNDRIHCIWGFVSVVVHVTSDHVDDPANNPLIVLIDKATIELVGDGGKIGVSFQAIDEVGNYPDPRSPWSAITNLIVDLKQNRLPEPIVIEADPDTDVIDLVELGEKDVTILVNTVGFKEGNIIRMTWIGTPAAGSQVIHGPIDLPVIRAGIAVTFSVPNTKVKAIAKGRATVAYVLKSEGVADRPSKNASVSVEGDISRLQAPSVLQAPGGVLPADSPLATVSVPYYEGRRSGDLITIHWQGTRPGGETYYSTRAIVSDEPEYEPIERSVPASEIAPLDGGSVKIHYTVANDDVMLSSVRDSLPLNLTVGVAQPELIEPDVLQADSNNVLLPENAPAGADVIAPFTGTVAGDTVGLRWVGSISGAHPLYEIPLSSHTAGQPVPFLVQPVYITANRNGKAEASYYVKRAGQPLRNSRVRTLSIGVTQPKWAAPEVLEAPEGRLDPNTHQNGFTVRVDTTALNEDDGIDLIGEGSIRPERRYVTSQPHIDFPILAPITGANLGRAVNIRYDVVRSTGPLPSENMSLQVGTLLLQNMPMPLLEGFDSEFMNTGGIQDSTKVLCTQWLFQLYGAPVWLSYIENRSDSTSRNHDQLAGEPNNRLDGLAHTAAVQWLRECNEGSTVSVVLKVGLFQAATLADAVACPVRIYTVRTGSDDWTTFTGGEWNGWSASDSGYPAKISEGGGEYFIEAQSSYLAINKQFINLAVGAQYELSFNYYITSRALLIISRTGLPSITADLEQFNTWGYYKLVYPNNSASPTIHIRIAQPAAKMDNIRLRQIT